jgi:hypothetical protein
MGFIKIDFVKISRICVGMIIGLIISFGYLYLFKPTCDFCQIQYISQDELIALEKKRIIEIEGIEGIKATDEAKNIFFGKSKAAIELITELARSKQERNNKILLTSGLIQGKGVKSISSEIHKLVIDKLKTEPKTEIQK